MSFTSINPANETLIQEIDAWDDERTQHALDHAARTASVWAAETQDTRAGRLRDAAGVLRDRRDKLARLMTTEMGKLISEARAEIDKCALTCDFYAQHAAGFLADEPIDTDAGKSYVAYQPLGVVLAIMPWNFPFWQVFRFAAPALAAGNVCLLKHASNVSLCALAIEDVFQDAGFPDGAFTTLLVDTDRIGGIIEDPRVRAVTLTGSEPAGRSVAGIAGAHLKKTVLELGGSDAFVVLDDADLELTVENAVKSRFQNAGQSCIAAKRFIVTPGIAEDFLEHFREAVLALEPGDPLEESTSLAPMARGDLRDGLHEQVRDALERGATAVTGCAPIDGRGFFYCASILDGVKPDMRAFTEELFGPVATVIRAQNEQDALNIANESPFGLGGSVWTRDADRGERLARRLECGAAFVNGLVKSDPRLPFGGVKHSGYGRELSRHGIREFVNAKSVWIH
ncbi:MAG: NAD-dependent succinate-semialdehyde dehydrogenase [Gammaproteobacteria bacterium]|nr:NAD-dependent succinate-semialdehyde dehydrogenase [Gammaproteobacteria bacterium]